MRQWEIWKGRPEGFKSDHWFVLISGAERMADSKALVVNGLACFKLQGAPPKTDVYLNAADGFAGPTACQCDLLYPLAKSTLHSLLGSVSFERQQQIKARLREVLRLL